jgi:hypothetical protein
LSNSLVVTQNTETFVLDHLDRLVQRVRINTNLSYNPITTDTVEIFSYVYTGNDSIVASYNHQTRSGLVNHSLEYDSQRRLLRDSVTNPAARSNKVTRFTYLPGMIVEYERQTLGAFGTRVKSDTFFLVGNDIASHKFATGTNVFTLSPHRNPLSYLSNFSLRASDYKNEIASLSFNIYTPYNVTFNQASQVAVNATAGGTSYVAVLNYSLDSLGRVKSFTNSANADKRTIFEY